MEDRRRRLLRRLHWTIVCTVASTYAVAYLRRGFTTQSEPANWHLLVIHMNAGLAVFLLALTAWVIGRRLRIRRPASNSPGRVAARCVHHAIYLLLFALPVSAYLGLGFDFPLLGQINLPGFARFELAQTLVRNHLHLLMISFAEPFAAFHRHLGSGMLLPLLLVGHVTAGIGRLAWKRAVDGLREGTARA